MNFIERFKIALNSVDEREYCECGCKNREDYNHGAKGYWRLKQLLNNASLGEFKILRKHLQEDLKWKN